ncbi:hypothetical protein EmuJ_000500700 [Echinococcus multilocularis]|uniref:Uncharacterized protein n=1 Tax=Echinococcus multilocularis TaxID=6211 RepID=A0A068XZ41_ECHMU|nr:hypothetical protein EmuJ_000500700 [Echinococcus multilocularis]
MITSKSSGLGVKSDELQLVLVYNRQCKPFIIYNTRLHFRSITFRPSCDLMASTACLTARALQSSQVVLQLCCSSVIQIFYGRFIRWRTGVLGQPRDKEGEGGGGNF